MADIFVSYRRANAAASAGRLVDRLSAHFGAERIFRDIDTIEAGDDFEHAIESAISNATAVLVVIDPQWLDSRNPDGSRRLDDIGDYVRKEVELALTLNALIIPILIDDARLPQPAQLPPSIRDLARRNAAELSQRRWQTDVEVLIREIERAGVPPADAGSSSQSASSGATRTTLDALVRFIPNLCMLARRPRSYLLRYSRGRGSDLTAACVFFALALALGLVVLLAQYTPAQSTLGFALGALVTGTLVTLVASLPLWVGWRIAGAKRHYVKVLVVLLHQSAVLHLVAFTAMSIFLFGADLVSRDLVSNLIAEFMATGQSTQAAIDSMQHRFAALPSTGPLVVASIVASFFSLAGVVWLVLSWGAYGEALEASRARSAIALAFAIVIGVAALALLRFVA